MRVKRKPSVADYSPLFWRLRITGAIPPLFPMPAWHAQGRLCCFQFTRLSLNVNMFALTLRCWSSSDTSLIRTIALFSIRNEFKNWEHIPQSISQNLPRYLDYINYQQNKPRPHNRPNFSAVTSGFIWKQFHRLEGGGSVYNRKECVNLQKVRIQISSYHRFYLKTYKGHFLEVRNLR